MLKDLRGWETHIIVSDEFHDGNVERVLDVCIHPKEPCSRCGCPGISLMDFEDGHAVVYFRELRCPFCSRFKNVLGQDLTRTALFGLPAQTLLILNEWLGGLEKRLYPYAN